MPKGPFHLPEGARFDLKTGRWFVPNEPSRLMLHESADGELSVYGGAGASFQNISIQHGLTEEQSITVKLEDEVLPQGCRGLVVGPPLQAQSSGNLTITGSGVDPQELRFASLFWDRLIFPKNNYFGFGLDRDSEFLQQEGILHTAQVDLIGGWAMGAGMSAMYSRTLQALAERDGERWSLARGERSPSLMPGSEATENGLVFDLHSVIPVPDRQVPLPDVLEFKRRRSDELQSLRGRLDELLSKIAADPEYDLAKRREMDALATAIEDHLKVSRETRFPLRLSGFKAKLDIKSWSSAAAGFHGATAYGMPPSIAALAAVGGGVLSSVSADVGWRGFKGSSSPYEYISRYHRDLF